MPEALQTPFGNLLSFLLLAAICLPAYLGLRTVPQAYRKRPIWLELTLVFLNAAFIQTPLFIFILSMETDMALACSLLLSSAIIAPLYVSRISWCRPGREVIKACAVSLGSFLLEMLLFIGAMSFMDAG